LSSANQQRAFLLTAALLLEVTVKAIRIRQYGDASTLKLEEISALFRYLNNNKEVAWNKRRLLNDKSKEAHHGCCNKSAKHEEAG
jgi:hypothetical protein